MAHHVQQILCQLSALLVGSLFSIFLMNNNNNNKRQILYTEILMMSLIPELISKVDNFLCISKLALICGVSVQSAV